MCDLKALFVTFRRFPSAFLADVRSIMAQIIRKNTADCIAYGGFGSPTFVSQNEDFILKTRNFV